MVMGSVLSTSRSITAAGSSRGANSTWRTVNAGCEYVSVVASGRTCTQATMSVPSMSSG